MGVSSGLEQMFMLADPILDESVCAGNARLQMQGILVPLRMQRLGTPPSRERSLAGESLEVIVRGCKV